MLIEDLGQIATYRKQKECEKFCHPATSQQIVKARTQNISNPLRHGRMHIHKYTHSG